MAVRTIRLEGDPILRKRCRETEGVDAHIRLLLRDMADTLAATENGAGLAACQVGILRRLIVIDMGDGPFYLVNPVLIDKSGRQNCVEGCLSFPGRFYTTVRPRRVVIEALDEHGRPRRLTGVGELAKCFCHELDHLDGILLPDRATGRFTP